MNIEDIWLLGEFAKNSVQWALDLTELDMSLMDLTELPTNESIFTIGNLYSCVIIGRAFLFSLIHVGFSIYAVILFPICLFFPKYSQRFF